MKKFEDMTLEETILKLNSHLKFIRRWEIILGFFVIGLVLYGIFYNENTAFIISIPIMLISPLILPSNLNEQVIAKLYEKIMKDDKKIK